MCGFARGSARGAVALELGEKMDTEGFASNRHRSIAVFAFDEGNR